MQWAQFLPSLIKPIQIFSTQIIMYIVYIVSLFTNCCKRSPTQPGMNKYYALCCTDKMQVHYIMSNGLIVKQSTKVTAPIFKIIIVVLKRQSLHSPIAVGMLAADRTTPECRHSPLRIALSWCRVRHSTRIRSERWRHRAPRSLVTLRSESEKRFETVSNYWTSEIQYRTKTIADTAIWDKMHRLSSRFHPRVKWPYRFLSLLLFII